jgi:photosystem II stability/assembly factor-like uncharacterized protein
MKQLLYTILILLITAASTFAQKKPKGGIPAATDAQSRMDGLENRALLEKESFVKNIKFRSVGPSIMSGRVTDLAVDPTDPTHFYVAYASGGLWETKNNGISLEPLFDQESAMTIGDIAVDWTNNTIWIGSGEVNSSRSSYAGVGMFKSTDGGKTWEHKGLEESHHIGRVILHPNDKNTLWVAVLGHLYSANEERGVYKTSDGGTTWKKVLYVSENAGAVDLVLGDASSPQTLYASIWHRERRAWNFVEAGSSSGIYKSADGGDTWANISGEGSGFPSGEGIGRIGLASAGSSGVLYALLDNQSRRAEEPKDGNEGYDKETFRTVDKAGFAALDNEKLESFLRKNNFPAEHEASSVKISVAKGEIQPLALTEYLEDANSLLFDTPVVGAEVYRSVDGGKTWQRTHEEYLDDVCYSYGYYFGLIRAAADNPDHVYIAGVPILFSEDGGKTFKSIHRDNVHADHHALWLNPNRAGHLILGNDGGVNISYDNGETWFKANSPAVGQFYTVNVDMAKPYNVYGGLQDNGVWKGSSSYQFGRSWHDEGKYPYERILGGDGMQVAVDNSRFGAVYTGYQFGNYYRLDQPSGEASYIQPKHKLGERPLRFNWQTPIHLSKHNSQILYLGSNKVHRSMQRGEGLVAISEDLTRGGKKGDVAYGTLSSIHESDLNFGLIYAGSDDGYIHVTKDGGNNWFRISDKLPQHQWVSRVQASSHKESRVYAALNGYRWDDFAPYVYVSEDYGVTWKNIGAKLPHEPVNVIKEDPVNENILYVGTDNGVYVSMDRGETYMRMEGGLPAVAVHDLVIHPRDNDLVLGTHGRSIYIANVSHLQKITPDLMVKNVYLFPIEIVRHSKRWGDSWSKWLESSSPSVDIPYWLIGEKGTKVSLTVTTESGLELKMFLAEAENGMNYTPYDLTVAPENAESYEKYLNEQRESGTPPIELEKATDGNYYLQKGIYNVKVWSPEAEANTSLEIK